MARASGEVTVWAIALDLPAVGVAQLEALLDEEERRRADRLQAGRGRFVVAHAALRVILAAECGANPSELRFSRAPGGKPRLAGSGLRFNLSHSGGYGLCALAWGREVGVDIEQVRPAAEDGAVVAALFAPAERAALEAMAPSERQAAFFQVWTRKEAYLKARGEGLGRDTRLVAVPPEPAPPQAILSVADPAGGAGWSLRGLDLGAGYAGAVAAEGHDWVARLRRWGWAGRP